MLFGRILDLLGNLREILVNMAEHSYSGKKHGSPPETWADLIHEKTVKDLLSQKNRELITLKDHFTLGKALEILEVNDILSAPVINAKKEFVGFVDVLDIAGYTLDAWNKLQSETLGTPQKRDYSRQEFFEATLQDLVNYSGVDPSVFVHDDDPIAHLLAMFCKHKLRSRLHRVAILNGSNQLINVISQTDLIRFAHLYLDVFPDVQLSDVEMFHPPIMVRVDSPFYSVLEILYRNKISGLALVDEQGRICGNFSASDLRGLTRKSFSYFTGSVLQFLAKATDVS